MFKDKKVVIIGGDKRFLYLFERIKKEAAECVMFNTNTEVFVAEDFLKLFDVIILPLPVTRDGVYINSVNKGFLLPIKAIIESIRDDAIVFGGILNAETVKLLEKRNIEYYDYYNDEAFLQLNSHLTALGTVKLITDGNSEKLNNKKTLITGYGHLSKALCNYLDELHMNVSVVARNMKSREDAVCHGFDAYDFPLYKEVLQRFDYIFNTVPSGIFSPENIKNQRKDTVFVELASRPFGTAPENFVSFDKKYICGQSLPGKYYPKECSEGIYDVITRYMSECDEA